MKSRVEKLTQRFVDRFEDCESSEEALFISDSSFKGLGVRLYPSGKKVFVLRYSQHAKSRWLTLGNARVLTLEDARTLARQALRDVAFGIDPHRRGGTTPTVKRVYKRWMKDHVTAHLAKSTAKEYRRYMEKEVLTRIGDLEIESLTVGVVSELHLSLQHTPYLANRVLASLSAMIEWAQRHGHSNPDYRNPCTLIKRFKETPKEKYMTAEELSQLFTLLDEYPNTKFRDVVKLLCLTGARKSEIERMEWRWVDWNKKTVELPDGKTGGRTIHLSHAAYEILSQRQPLYTHEVFVFPVGRSHYKNTTREWARFREGTSLQSYRLHDLRHSFASLAANNGASLQVIGDLLGHSNTQTTQRYAHLYDDTLKEAVADIGRAVA